MASDLTTARRYEVKYLVPTRSVEAIAGELTDYLRPDPHSRDPRGYPIFSIYWDSPGFELFWEKIEGLKDRRKLRFRRYLGSDDVVLEIKHRQDRTLRKRRARLPLALAAGSFRDPARLDWEQAADPVVREAMLMIERLRLAPRAGILYRRRALFGAFDPELRVTFDSRLMYRVHDLDLARPFDTGKYLLDPRATVMEVKYTDRVPGWLTKLIRRRELTLVRMSKYCAAVDREYFQRQLA
jgi:hypothetical protein